MKSMKLFLLLLVLLIGSPPVEGASVNVTITANAGQPIASIDLSNTDAPATVANAEVGRLWVTMSPFYPTASAITWSISGTNTCGLHLSSSSGAGVQLLTAASGGTSAQVCSDTIITATVGTATLSSMPTITVRSGTKAVCGSGSTISSAISTAGTNGTVILDACTYTGQTFNPLSGQRIQGSGPGKTIIDGTGLTGALFNNNTPNVTIDSVEVKGYMTGFACVNSEPTITFSNDGAVLKNSYLHDTGCAAISMNGTGSIVNNRFSNNGLMGAFVYFQTTSGTSGVSVTGNEFDLNNSRGFTQANAASGLKVFAELSFQHDTPLTINNNYAHDNASNGLWVDTVHNVNSLISIQGNTVIDNHVNGIMFEASCKGDISRNFVNGNSGGPYISLSPTGRSVWSAEGGPVNIHHNVIKTISGTTAWSALTYESQTRSDACSQGTGQNFYNNNITFTDNNATHTGYGYRVISGGVIGTLCSGLTSCNSGQGGPNAFHDLLGTTSTVRFFWQSGGVIDNFAAYKSASGNDTTSTYDNTDGTTGITGCLHIACTGAGL